MSRIVIIGGGAIGLSVAYHLAKRGALDVVLLERNQLTSGTSWHAAGIVGPLRATPNMTRLASYALKLFPWLETETGMSTGYRRTGGYWLARRPERLDELNRIASLGRTQGLNPRMIATGGVLVPQLELKNHVGALHVPEDGNVNPVDLCMAYARAARWMGVDIRENTGVQDLLVSDGRAGGVVLADRSKLLADTVILCTGAWSRELAARAGIKLPLQAVEHMYVVTEPMPGLPDPFPVIRDLDTGIYIKGDTGKLVIGGFEPDAKCWNAYGQEGDRPFLELAEDWDQFAPFMDAALDLVPSLANTGIQHFMNGPESFTTDTRPLVGETPTVDGLFVAAGMNSVGIMSSAGIGKALADWVIDGQPRNDLWEVDVARTDPRAASSEHLAASMSEAVSDLFAMHWPFKQPTAGRKLRTSPLHECWAEQGAVFGVTAGWERGLWYAQGPAELDLPYSVGEQSWYPIVRREAASMTNGAALIDLTPFTKLRLSGPSALAGLNYLSSAQLDVPVNKTVYTQFMNSRGGIEMDVTVTRVAKDNFDITSGAATRWRDLGWLRRNLPSDVDIADLTDDSCVIGLMGPASRNILTALCKDWPDISFGHAADISIAGLPVRATRISYVGELGWELRVGNSDAKLLFSKLLESEAVPMGHYALDACRIEKGYRHWGHEIGPDLTPLEAGLGFTMDWTKDSIAKQALRQQRDNGVTRRLILMQIEGDPLILHDEPIFENETHIGLTTSGGVGARTGLTLAFGLISTSPNETLTQICERRFQVEVAGQRYWATPLARPPYDPDNRRMRA